MRKIYLFLIFSVLQLLKVNAQVSLTNGSPNVLIDFSNTTPASVGTNPTSAFTGAGFSPNPTTAGRLNSNAWAVTGWSDGNLAFGGTRTTANTDYTRGTTADAQTTGGMYAYTGSPASAANPTLMIQPGGSDWAPGTLTLRIQNNGTTPITQLAVSYNIYIRNDQNRANSFNFSHSADDATYTSIPALDYTSPQASDALGWVLVGTAPSRSTTITGLNIAPGSYYYIRWSGADVSGSGSRDEFGLDDINITATFLTASTDYFRSATSGNWSSTASWESSPDNVTWIPATLVPDQNANTITIRNGHTITVDAPVTADQLVVESGATLSVNSALTINDGTGTDLTVNGTLIAAATVTNNGTTNINNIFQINDGGFGGGTDFVYAPAATLVFNNTTLPYGVNGDAYWPAVNGPANVTVQNTGNITMNVPRTVTGLFQTARGVLNGNNLTLNGTVQINTNGYFSNAPIYGAGSTLIYNTGGTYSRGDEWNATGVGTIGSTNGYPNHVIVRNNTTIDLPNGSNVDRACAGDLTIETGSALYADYGGGSVNLTVGRDLIINGGYISLGGSSGGDLHVRRNFTYNSGTFNTNGRAVFFDGPSGDQTITGAVTFAYLIVDKAAGNVILNSSINCTNSLTLTSGKIVLGANDITLSNDVPGSLSASATAYVVTNGTGTLKRAISTANGNQDYSFPVGSLSNWQPVTLNFPTISANNTIAARFISGAPMGTTGLPLTESGDEIARAANNGYWEVTAASATTDTYTGTFNANGFTDITDYTKVHLIKRADGSSPWTLDGTHVTTTGSNSAAVLQRTGMSGFSQFAVGGKSNLSLPVTLLSFSGYKNGSRNQLSWTTGSEQNNLGFEVQRSTDGVNYTVIGFVNSVATGGNSSDRLSYSFTDNAPAGVKQYYRLRQVDIDGRSKLSNIVLINGTKPAVITLRSIFPNPAADVAQIIIDAPAQAVLTVLVSDMAGRTLMQQIANIAEGSNTVVLPVAALHSGTYLVRVMNEQGEVVTGKLLKQ